MKSITVYLSLRQRHFVPRRNSAFSGVFITQGPQHLPEIEDRHEIRHWMRGCCRNNQPQPPDNPVPERISASNHLGSGLSLKIDKLYEGRYSALQSDSTQEVA
ncbi:hypothetical protein L9F63_002655, partial [Diploptera punctata]